MWTVREASSKAERGEPTAIQREKMPARKATRRDGEIRPGEEWGRANQPRRKQNAVRTKATLIKMGGDHSLRMDWASADMGAMGCWLAGERGRARRPRCEKRHEREVGR